MTFEEKGGKTLPVLHELYASKVALDTAGTRAADMMGETFAQLDESFSSTRARAWDGHEVVDLTTS